MRLFELLVAAALFATPAAIADEASYSFGGDQYAAGQEAAIGAAVTRDAFAAGYNVSITAPVQGDAHLGGFNVSTTAPVTGDVYGAGFSVTLGAPVGADVTAMGNSVTLQPAATVAGNLRAAGQTVTLDGPVAGSALVTAQTLRLNTTVAGDLSFIGEAIVFSPGAKVTGKVSIQAPKEIAVPAEVASADRVSFTKLVDPDYMGEAGRTAQNVVNSFWPAFWAMVGWFALLLVIGAVLIALFPTRLRALEIASAKRPFRTFGIGILAFASTLGLVVVAVLTLIGIVVVPFVFIYVAIACSIAYLTGAYLIALRVGGAFVQVDTNLKRLGILALGLALAAFLGLIPFIGWLITLCITSFGFGALAVVTMVRWSAGDAQRLGGAQPPAATAAPAA